jgi:hypothetical protein
LRGAPGTRGYPARCDGEPARGAPSRGGQHDPPFLSPRRRCFLGHALLTAAAHARASRPTSLRAANPRSCGPVPARRIPARRRSRCSGSTVRPSSAAARSMSRPPGASPGRTGRPARKDAAQE